MGERQQQLQKKRIAKLALLEKQTSDIVYYSLWQSVAQITSSIQTIKNVSEKKEAFKSQLRFQKNLLKQKAPIKEIYNFTKVVDKQRRDLTVEELVKNVESLVGDSMTQL